MKTKFKIYYTVIEDARWNKHLDEDNLRIFEIDENREELPTRTEAGIDFEDYSEENQKAINKAINNWMNPNGGIDWNLWATGKEDYSILTVELQ